jgi:hypothetical protein
VQMDGLHLLKPTQLSHTPLLLWHMKQEHRLSEITS